MRNLDKTSLISFLLVVFLSLGGNAQIRVAEDHRRFVGPDGKTFFWLGDTGWLLFNKTTREDALKYLDIRKKQGFNVIQVMVLHDMPNNVNKYGDSAVHQLDISRPFTTNGANPKDAAQYDFWDHVEFIVQEAGKRGIHMALVPLWGSNMKIVKPTDSQIKTYGAFIAKRFAKYPNIIWLNGGDVAPGEYMAQWELLARTIKLHDKKHIMTYHPRGRFTSGDWFHNAEWLDFHMFQSGHKRYDQDTSAKDIHHFGEDNWRFVQMDLAREPKKPSIDGEPSYENIPHALHDSLEKRWTDADLRRYAYWSVLAGAPGFTYGENAVMQLHRPGDWDRNFGVTNAWDQAIFAPGAEQMRHLKSAIQVFGQQWWQPVTTGIYGSGERYRYILAAGNDRAVMYYLYEKRSFQFEATILPKKVDKTYWMDPATGKCYPAKMTLTNGKWDSGPIPTGVTSTDIVLIITQP